MNPFIFEAIMLVCFGLAWPVSIYKSYTSRSNKGKSLYFLLIIFIGYINGIIFQLILAPKVNYDLYIFLINIAMVGLDILLYYRNMYLEYRDTH